MSATPQSLTDALAEVGILGANPRMSLSAIGRDQKLLCPACDGGRTREKSLSFKLDEQGGAVWSCKRATCGWSGNVPGHRPPGALRNLGQRRPKAYRRPEPPADPQRPQALYDWFARRGISRGTVDRFGIYRTRRYIAQAGGEVAVTAFPYTVAGELVGCKYRHDYRDAEGRAAKTFSQEADTEPTLYNADALNPDEVIFVEGEMDVLALAEAGITNAVSLRDGAPTEGERSDRRYEPLRTHWQQLKEVGRFVLAGDMDEPGQRLREALAQRLGRERCHLVEWPEGCKDANETLLRHGPEVVRACVAAARPHPIEGLYNLDEIDIALLDDTRWMRTVSTGSAALDELFRVPERGRFWVVTGIPNMGKSTWLNWLVCGLAARHGWKGALFSPETDPWQLHGQLLCEIYKGKRWRTMTAEEKADAVAFVGAHFTHIVPPDDDDRDADMPEPGDEGVARPAPRARESTLDWLIEQVRICVLRDGVRFVVVDPWNELEHQRPKHVSLTEYANGAVRRLKALCRRFDVHVFLVAHPKKLDPGEVPGGYAISDSAAFANKADFGITVHQPTPGAPTVEIWVWKCRFRAYGKKGKVLLEWQEGSDRYLDLPVA